MNGWQFFRFRFFGPFAPSDGRKRSKKSESEKLPTIHDDDQFESMDFPSVPTDPEMDTKARKMFSVGHSDTETEAEQKDKEKKMSKKKRKHKTSNFTEEELKLRRARGSE